MVAAGYPCVMRSDLASSPMCIDPASMDTIAHVHTWTSVRINTYKCMHTHMQAYDAGHVIAPYNIGLCYKHGWGIEQNTTLAISWFRVAAEKVRMRDCVYGHGECTWT